MPNTASPDSAAARGPRRRWPASTPACRRRSRSTGGSPARSRISSPWPSRSRSAAIRSVRVSCQTMALPVRLAGLGVPDHGGLALVGDADRDQVRRGQPGVVQGPADDLLGPGPDLARRRVPPSRPGAGSAVFAAGRGPPRGRHGRRSCSGCWSCPGRLLPRSRPCGNLSEPCWVRDPRCGVPEFTWQQPGLARLAGCLSARTRPSGPREWEADVLLTDGGVAQLRPINPSDAALLVEFYDRVSPESKYLRFFAPVPAADGAGRGAVHPGRLRRPGRVDPHRGRAR